MHVLVEGWRRVPHSYATVAQSFAAQLLTRHDVDLRFRDLPFLRNWSPIEGLVAPETDAALAAAAKHDDAFKPDVTFTVRAQSLDATAVEHGRRYAFGTPEYRVLNSDARGSVTRADDLPSSTHILTCSEWCALAYERFGVSRDRVHVVPLGIDPAVFSPATETARRTREALGLGDSFAYLSMGAMTWNKGPDVLLRAFAHVIETEPDAKLILKGTDAIYRSRDSVRHILGLLSSRARDAVASRLVYNGDTYSASMIADLYRASDAYVSPYRAEGFNLPVLEALASGLWVICTEAGPTDEFAFGPSVKRVRSTRERVELEAGVVGEYLEPDLDDLVHAMRQASRDRDRKSAFASEVASIAHRDFSWARSTDRLLDVFASSAA